ncbi:MAG: 50S ribosomal protein L3 [Alphaproteobacteria bacterium]
MKQAPATQRATKYPSRAGLLAKKIGMTRVFNDKGQQIPVTVLQVDNLQVVAHRTKEKNGYTAIQVGAFAQKAQRLSKPVAGHFRKAGVEAKKVLAEFRMEGDLPAVGTALTADYFTAGQMVDVSGITKGRGFAGVIKRWNFSSGRASHGNSLSHRIHGSTGSRQDPGKVFKNKKMAGHLGVENVTTQNLEVVGVDAELSVIMVKGSVPGNKGSLVMVRDAIKAKTAK